MLAENIRSQVMDESRHVPAILGDFPVTHRDVVLFEHGYQQRDSALCEEGSYTGSLRETLYYEKIIFICSCRL